MWAVAALGRMPGGGRRRQDFTPWNAPDGIRVVEPAVCPETRGWHCWSSPAVSCWHLSPGPRRGPLTSRPSRLDEDLYGTNPPTPPRHRPEPAGNLSAGDQRDGPAHGGRREDARASDRRR